MELNSSQYLFSPPLWPSPLPISCNRIMQMTSLWMRNPRSSASWKRRRAQYITIMWRQLQVLSPTPCVKISSKQPCNFRITPHSGLKLKSFMEVSLTVIQPVVWCHTIRTLLNRISKRINWVAVSVPALKKPSSHSISQAPLEASSLSNRWIRHRNNSC